MHIVLKIILKIIGYALTVLVASSVIPGFTFIGDWRMLLAAGIILTVVHAVVLPVLKILTFPLALITFGLFHVVLTAVILWIAVLLIPGVHLDSISSGAFAVVAIGITGVLLSYI